MSRRVLVVDDDATIRRVVRTVLESAEFEVVEAPDGASALEILGGSNGDAPPVVVLDVMMPVMDGVEVCRRIDTSATRVLMLTARDDGYTKDACQDAGATAFLTKPFSSIELLDAVEELLPA